METIQAFERRALVTALRLAGPALIKGDAITPQQLSELENVLAAEDVLLVARPEEKLFSVPVRISMLAADAEEATRLVRAVLNEAEPDNEQFITFDMGEPNADSLALLQSAYGVLADVRNGWPGRHTAAGQNLLIGMRDAISKATGLEAQDVQDEQGWSCIISGAYPDSRPPTAAGPAVR